MGNGYKKKHQTFSVQTTQVAPPPETLISVPDIVVTLPSQGTLLGSEMGGAMPAVSPEPDEIIDVAELDGALIDLLPEEPQPGWTEAMGISDGTGVLTPTATPGVYVNGQGAVIPSGGVPDSTPDPVTGQAVVGGFIPPTAYQEDLAHAAKAKLDLLRMSWEETAGNEDLTATEKHAALGQIADDWRDELEVLLINGAYEPFVATQRTELRALTGEWLADQPKSALDQIAADNGFANSVLISHGALSHALDPAYLPELESKLKIWQAAERRYADLVSGEMLSCKGVTLADVEAANQHLAAPTAIYEAAPWDAATVSALHTTAGPSAAPAADTLLHLRKVLAANPVDDNVKAAADALAVQLRAQADLSNTPVTRDDAAKLINAGAAPQDADLLSPEQVWRIAHPDTAPSVKLALIQLAQHRATHLDEYAAEVAAGHGAYDKVALLPKIGTDAVSVDDAVAAFNAAHKFRPDKFGWSHNTVLYGPFNGVAAHPLDAEAVKKNLKTQPLDSLRETAKELGLADALVANRADVTKYLVGYAAADGVTCAKVSAGVKEWAAKQAAKNQVAPVAAPPASSGPEPTPPTTLTPTVVEIGQPNKTLPSKFKSNLLVLRSKIKAAVGLKGDLPKRVDLSAVQQMQFTRLDENPGGAHSKDVLFDGQNKWISKPDKTAGGTRARSEAIVSELSEALGMPTVPVYAVKRNDKLCSIQPWVAGSKTFAHNGVAAADQATADIIMREAPFSMFVGDWDGSEGNWLVTPNHGMVRCDAGQAFRWWGTDDASSLSYKPNAGYGQVSLHVQLLEQTRDGTGTGTGKANVAAALPTLHSIEQMPDAQLRSILAPIAESGALTGQGVFWYQEMRQRAETKHGANNVGAAEVAAEFLDHAVERKRGLRAQLRKLCVEAGVDVTALDHDPAAPDWYQAPQPAHA